MRYRYTLYPEPRTLHPRTLLRPRLRQTPLNDVSR